MHTKAEKTFYLLFKLLSETAAKYVFGLKYNF